MAIETNALPPHYFAMLLLVVVVVVVVVIVIVAAAAIVLIGMGCYMVQVTLMTQNIGTIRSSLNGASATSQPDVADNSDTADESGKPSSHHKLSNQSGVEVVCGPVELAKYVDLSGTQGVVPLTSMKLLKVKSKSFLLRFKSKSNRAEKNVGAADKPTQVNLFVLFSF